ncbi:MAG: hypothetical protein HY466_06040 [Deltaproteobacteria bacterium]|nr:hypothetical protein [Deltaproteobacteria bacterium]
MVDRIDTKFTRLPPAWLSRAARTSGNIGQSEEIRKLLGEPIPQRADINQLPPRIAEMFDSNGILERLAKKLASFSKRRHKKIVPARNTIASVDEDNNVYVGVEFLEKYGDDEDLLAGILAHEWGHMISDLPKGMNWSHLTWEELHQLRRDEEADADGYAGRALYLMGYKPEQMMDFLRQLQKRRNPKLPSIKYHNTATRLAILKASFEAQARAFETAEKILLKPKKIIGQG